jgi:hypothetical protein
VSFTDEERAELIGALSRTADMVAGLLDALDILRVALEAGRQTPRCTWLPAPQDLRLTRAMRGVLIFVIVGPSGCGKSTFLRHLFGSPADGGRSGATARAFSALAPATREVALTIIWADDRAADEGAVTPNSDWWDRAKQPPRPQPIGIRKREISDPS